MGLASSSMRGIAVAFPEDDRGGAAEKGKRGEVKGGVMVGMYGGRGQPVADARSRRRSRQSAKRSRTVRFALTDAEYAELTNAAESAGLAVGAYAAEAALAATRGVPTPADGPLREVLGELIRAAGLTRRIGVNLNQAVAKLHATGRDPGNLGGYAAEALRRARKLDEAAEGVRRCLP